MTGLTVIMYNVMDRENVDDDMLTLPFTALNFEMPSRVFQRK